MLVSSAIAPIQSTDADTVAVGLIDGMGLPVGAPQECEELLSSGEAKPAFKSLAVTHAQGKRWILVGLGAPSELSAEKVRVAAAAAHGRALELSTATLAWQLPTSSEAADPLALAGALVEGTVLADYRFDRFKSAGAGGDGGDGDGAGQAEGPRHLEALVVGAGPESGIDEGALADVVSAAALVAAAVNAARDLQNRPGNDLTPTALADYAVSLAADIDTLTVEVEARAGLIARSMGAFAAVAQGSEQEPALITMHYKPTAAGTAGATPPPVLGLVGKAVTFDSGGISLKPGAKMWEMKFDMSGGAAVIEATTAIARLGLPIEVIAVVGATENLPSGRAVKPGDIVTASNGKTIEVNNTDAEGRMVLADCLAHAVSLGAQRIVDLATLTGAVIIALGSTHAGLMSNDDEWAARVGAAAEQTGEITWRLPLHSEYDDLVKGTFGDLNNAPEDRKAGTIVGAAFLSNFVGDVPWVHLDIAGTAWDLGRGYAPKGASGFGVRLLVELARSYC